MKVKHLHNPDMRDIAEYQKIIMPAHRNTEHSNRSVEDVRPMPEFLYIFRDIPLYILSLLFVLGVGFSLMRSVRPSLGISN
jgi:hypothetical protein